MTIINCEWPYGLGENSYTIIPYTQISEKTPEIPGLYIWLIKPYDRKQALLCSRIFQQVSLTAIVEGNIRLQYKGKLLKNYRIDDSDSVPSVIGDEFMSNLFFATGYPLYIGISKNLKQRLAKHHEQFSTARKTQVETTSDNIMTGLVESDSEEESKFFGARLEDLWPKELDETNLYVKIISANRCQNKLSCSNCDKECSESVRTAIRDCETLANSIFNPVFGRR